MANITQIVSTARGLLGDSAGIRYSEPAIEVMLTNALIAVNADASTSFEYDASTRTISPEPANGRERYIIALALAFITLVGEETTSALDGGGMTWKSGLSTINLSGFHKAVSESAKSMMKLYDKAILKNKISDSVAGDIDLYRTGSDVVEVN